MATKRPQDIQGPELIWSGPNAKTSEVIAAALGKAGIPYHAQSGVVKKRSSSLPTYAIFIPSSHRDAAQEILEALRVTA